MDTVEILVVGAVVGLIAYEAHKYFSQDFSISPTTGGVNLPDGTVYGPAVPTSSAPVVPGPIVEGLN